MISTVVHLDETTPHMHLNFIPINEGRLSSKSLFDRQKLAQLQTELHESIGRKWGLQRGKEGSQAKHLSTAEYKAKKIIEGAEQREREIDEQTEKKRAELDDLIRNYLYTFKILKFIIILGDAHEEEIISLYYLTCNYVYIHIRAFCMWK